MKVSIIGGGGLVGSSAGFALQCGGIVREIALLVEQHENGLEPERLLQPAERRLAVLVTDGARKPLRSRMVGHVSSPES